MSKLLLEISCASAADALLAQAAGADRIELCSSLFLGGLTPSAGEILLAHAVLRIPFVVMIRPRRGGFCYSDAEFATMQRDVEFAIENGAAGVVLGTLRADGTVNVHRCKHLKALAQAGELVLHRAFDTVPDPFRALDESIDLGFTRVLTSGQRPTAVEGADILTRLVEHAKDRIQILPAGGIRPYNVEELIRRTGCDQVHLAPLKIVRDSQVRDGRAASLKFGAETAPPQSEHEVIDVALVEEMSRILKQF
jgi:copper homeostasis protein